jgi:hypothetical protein
VPLEGVSPGPILVALGVVAAGLSGCASGCGGGPGGGGDPTHRPPLELPPPLSPMLSEDGGARSPAPPAASGPGTDPNDFEIPGPGGDPPHAPWLRIFLSQDNRGEMDPCGCPGSPTGGIARRAAWVQWIRRMHPEAVVVEGPTALRRAILGPDTVSPEDRERARALLRLVARSEPLAFFPGQADLEVLPPEELIPIADEYRLPVVVTNLFPGTAGDGLRPWIAREVDDRQVLFLGLLSSPPDEAARRRLPLRDGVEATRHAVEAARAELGRVDLVVAFSDAGPRELGLWRDAGLDVDVLVAPEPPADTRRFVFEDGNLRIASEPLGRALQRVDVVFTGPDGRAELLPPGSEWPLHAIAGGEDQWLKRRERLDRDPGATDAEIQRRALAEIKATRSRGLEALRGAKLPGHLAATTILGLDPDLPEDPLAVQIRDAFHREHAQGIKAASQPTAPVEVYVGLDACVECHAPTSAHWALTPHAQTWKDLVERGSATEGESGGGRPVAPLDATHNPDCLGCHSTGYGKRGGFVDPDADSRLLNVQCEACHGPMKLHVDQARRPGFRPSPGLPVDEATCRGCHDPANSPKFEYLHYLERVEHPSVAARRKKSR